MAKKIDPTAPWCRYQKSYPRYRPNRSLPDDLESASERAYKDLVHRARKLGIRIKTSRGDKTGTQLREEIDAQLRAIAAYKVLKEREEAKC